MKCVAGESLYVGLEGIKVDDADLFFSGEYGNFTLVRWRGDHWGRCE